VTVTNSFGCKDTACEKVTVETNCGELFIPDAFSPNGDLHNDYFVPRNVCLKTLHLTVYDRWGVKVFETDDVNTKGWDGTYKSRNGESDVFGYYYSFELVNGDTGTKKGTVSLIK
jgi:gliding motility-associated-like protein